jgi:hypothetical protein
VSPVDFGPLGTLVVLGLLYILVSSLLYLFVKILLKLSSHFIFGARIHPKKFYRMVYVIALAPIFLLALNSLGQLQFKDFVLVVLLIGLGCFYISRQTKE